MGPLSTIQRLVSLARRDFLDSAFAFEKGRVGLLATADADDLLVVATDEGFLTALVAVSALSALESGLLVPIGIFRRTPDSLLEAFISPEGAAGKSETGLLGESGVGTGEVMLVGFEGGIGCSDELGRAACIRGIMVARDAGLRELV